MKEPKQGCVEESTVQNSSAETEAEDHLKVDSSDLLPWNQTLGVFVLDVYWNISAGAQ